MMASTPERSQQSYRHEAYLWHDSADFTAGLVPFVEEGLEADEPVMVALVPEHTTWLRDALGEHADAVEFVDMTEIGGNPARIIPAWREFLDRHSGAAHPARGIGEPIWPGRRDEEVVECQLHEALLNVAIDPESPFWLICPYDAEQLGEQVVDEAHRSHPVIVEAGSYRGSSRYGGRAHVDTLFGTALEAVDAEPLVTSFDADTVGRLFGYVKLELYVAGLSIDKASDLAAATQRLAMSSLHRSAAGGRVRIFRQRHALTCEVSDETLIDDLLVGRRPPFGDDHDGLWLANQLCDLVQVRSTPDGTTVRAHAWRQ